MVVIGADCAVLGAAAVDETGTAAYCARADSQSQETVWSPQPERLRTAAPTSRTTGALNLVGCATNPVLSRAVAPIPSAHLGRAGPGCFAEGWDPDMTSNTAADIVNKLGGAANIESLSHCATRLRFQLRDAAGVAQSDLESVSGVHGCGAAGGQPLPGGHRRGRADGLQPDQGAAGHGRWCRRRRCRRDQGRGPRQGPARQVRLAGLVLRVPLRLVPSDPRRAAGGFAVHHLHGADEHAQRHPELGRPADASELSPSWQFINLCWQSVFVFLPLMVAYNAAKKLNADPWVGFAIMAVVMLPGFAALKDFTEPSNVFGSQVDIVQIFGLPLTIFNYSSQVFPPLLMAAVLGPLYKLLKRMIPENVQLIFVPFLSMLIMIPLTAFLIGPIGVYTGAGLANILKSINDFSPLIFAILIPLAYPFMVPLGLHWPINAIMLLNIQTLGYDFIQGPMGAWNFACFGATAGVLFLAWRERDAQMRQTAIGGLAAGLLGGISEPSLYGIHLRFKRIYPRMLVGCLVGGLIIGLGGGVKTNAFVFTSLLTIPAFDNMALVCVRHHSRRSSPRWSWSSSPDTAHRSRPQNSPRPGCPVADLEGPMSQASTGTLIAAAQTKAAGDAGVVTEILSPLAGTVVALERCSRSGVQQGNPGPGHRGHPVGQHRLRARLRRRGRRPADWPCLRTPSRHWSRGAHPYRYRHGELKGEGFDVHVAKGQTGHCRDPAGDLRPQGH